jgi:hypothetical protein
MEHEEISEEIRLLLDPEPDSEVSGRDIPHPKLTELYGLDTSYLEGYNWEGSTMHPRTRLCPTDADRVHILSRNYDVPVRLIESAMRLFGDSVLAYHNKAPHTGQLRYYPPIILTLWSGFETFVRYSSELFLATAAQVAPPIAEYLREVDSVADRHGKIVERSRNQPVLDRYSVLLKHAYGYEVQRGSRHWQALEAARDLRDYYTHLDVTDPRSVSTQDVEAFVEAIFLGIIWPSCSIKRTLLLGIYNWYWTWDSLRSLAGNFIEQPFFKDWPIGDEGYQFYCPFNGVDTLRFPNHDEEDRSRRSPSNSRPGRIES